MRYGIARTLLARLVAEARASPEAEVCGLLFGSDSRITAAEPAANVAATPATRFEIDPAALFRAIRAERAGGRPVIGHYHSHPSGRAEPSPCDAAAAAGTGELWMIIGASEVALYRALGAPGGGAVFTRLELLADPPES